MYLLSSYLFILLLINNQINSHDTLPFYHQRLASLYCFIDDYSSWLEEQSLLDYFLQFAQFFYYDTERIEQQLEQYRLQRECLRALERLPIFVGSG